VHRPEEIFYGLIRKGDTVLDIGCGMGFFTLAMAAMVGGGGRVFALDIQEEMLVRVRRRASRKGLSHRIAPILCEPQRLSVPVQSDWDWHSGRFHEVPDPRAFLKQVKGLLKPEGRLLLVEPKGHVPEARFRQVLEIGRAEGLSGCGERRVSLSRVAVLQNGGCHFMP
jgi:ubiquinone/menaquinone biosynthesis C-methylase UbiE